jgi:hypothetical protein
LSGDASESIYYAPNIASAAANGNTVTVTFSGSTPYPDVRILEFNGVATANALDIAAGSMGTSTSSSSGSVTTTNASDLLIGGNYVATSTSVLSLN